MLPHVTALSDKDSMTENLITCPRCGADIPVQQALGERIRHELEESLRKDHEARIAQAVREAEIRKGGELATQLADLDACLREQTHKAETAQKAELELRKQAREIEERARGLDLEVERKLDGERRRVEQSIRQSLSNEQNLKLREKEKQIDDLRKSLDDARRKSEQGSQETQGEVLEMNFEAALRAQFPCDRLKPVAKGQRGADLVHEVCNNLGEACGQILWEIKNTKHFSPGWIDKLKEDQRAAGASLSVLVSVALPEAVREFGQVNGVWVVGLRAWPALAVALRDQLVQVAFARAAAKGRRDKMALIYQYLSGDEFRHRVEAIVEGFTAMQTQLERERRAMEKLWKERERQIRCIVTNTVGMYGEMRGLIGAGMPEIEALELDGVALLEDAAR
ncbi:MAG: DUF2130 domain-containing protein [Gammaproteobacteria bacterium]|nr:DUF2130 domain-containing protein [Gammaproteobacteria bacterium]